MDNKELSGVDFGTAIAENLFNDGIARIGLPAKAQCDMAHMMEAADAFFALGAQAKNAASLIEQCGYRPMGVEYSVSADRPDLIESFTYSPRAREAASRLAGESGALWKGMEANFHFLQELANAALCGLATHYEDRTRFVSIENPFSQWSRLQINLSRPALNAGSQIHEYHEDGDFFTIATALTAGLQIELVDGSSEEGPSSLREVIFMPGEILHLMTGGEIRPAYHRVISLPKLQQRLAVMFFADIDPCLCQPWRNSPVNAGVDIGQIVRRSGERFGLTGFSVN
jgi:isopenicillin N synthase-like dioxygenase